MTLNLNSLKNLSETIGTEDISDTPKPVLNNPLKVKSAENPKNTSDAFEDKQALGAGPKISLMKLKKASGMRASETTAQGSDYTHDEVAGSKDPTPSEIKQILNLSASSSSIQDHREEDALATTNQETAIETLSVEQPAQDSQEARSIIFDQGNDASVSKETSKKSTDTEEQKEFFPNFHILDTLDIKEDLLNIPDIIAITEHREESASSQEHIVALNSDDMASGDMPSVNSDKEGVIVAEDTEISAQEPSLEKPETAILETASEDASIAITPEYVAEVKTELSENRRAGFRFFVQRKTKIIAGISLMVLSVSAVMLFSDALLSDSLQKSGKSSVQETAGSDIPHPVESIDAEHEFAAPTTTTIATEIASTMEKTDYEIGIDYSVIKNTKKNIRSKSSSGAIPGIN